MRVSDIAKRKAEHLKLAMEDGSQTGGCQFDNLQLPVKSLPEIDLKEIDTGTMILGKKISQPLIIASMTGGSEQGLQINTNLAQAAEKCRVALGVGSQRAALEKTELRKTFEVVRKYAPTTLVFANMGAVQLNYGRTVDDYRRVVEMVHADGLYLHINPMQEAIQPEGDTNWSNLKFKIRNLKKELKIPVFVKEVGNGLDAQTCKDLMEMGVAGIDIAGVGGTSWTWIEAQRAKNPLFAEWFKDFGVRTEDVLPVVAKVTKSKTKIVASGGLRSPIQGLKAHLLGADYYSAARPFLETALVSAEATIELIENWQKGLKIAMFGCGMKGW